MRQANDFAARNLCLKARQLYWRRTLQEYVSLFTPGEMQAFIDEEVWPLVLAQLRLGLRPSENWVSSANTSLVAARLLVVTTAPAEEAA